MTTLVAPAWRGEPLRTIAAGTLAAFAVAFSFLSVLLSPAGARATELRPWDAGQVQRFTLPIASHGLHVSLDAHRGDPVLVHFFATWCEPCREELPALQRLAERGAADGLRVVAISVAEPKPRVERFLAAMPLNFPVLLDAERAVARDWKISILPSTVILDADHKPALIVESDFAWDRIEPHQLRDQLKTMQATTSVQTPSGEATP